MDFRLIAAGHTVLVVLLLVELGLTGYVVSLKSSHSEVKKPLPPFSFMLFNTIWSIAALTFVAVIPLVFSYAYHNLVALFVLATTAIFWLAGSIAVAVVLGTIGYNRRNISSIAQPVVAFSFSIWAIFTVLTSLEVLGVLKGAYRNDITQLVEHGEERSHRLADD